MPTVRNRFSSRSASSLEQRNGGTTARRTGDESKGLKLSCLHVFLLLFILYLIPPIVVRYSSWARDAAIFVHHVRTPYFRNISDPSSFGVNLAREFKLYQEDGCVIETWQILPEHYSHQERPEVLTSHISEKEYISALSDGAPIVLYLHGNTGTRATYHRVRLYKYLTEMGHHLITFDYRGFANSECYPSERGMMEDSKLVWNWIKKNAPDAKVYIWGHSLGSAAATYLTKGLCIDQDLPSGLILDAPITNIVDAAKYHFLTLPYWPLMPIFSYFVLESFEDKFDSKEYIKHITCPILILHGQSDFVVPFHLGKELYDTAVKHSQGEVEFVDGGFYGHKSSWESTKTKETLKKFIKP